MKLIPFGVEVCGQYINDTYDLDESSVFFVTFDGFALAAFYEWIQSNNQLENLWLLVKG